MRPPEAALPLPHALALGALHGPAELLPVSSSAHTELVPWLLGWPYATLDGELRKAFEVALHAGTLGGLLVLVRRPRAAWAVVATAPAATRRGAPTTRRSATRSPSGSRRRVRCGPASRASG